MKKTRSSLLSQAIKLSAQDPLETLHIPYLDFVLEEIFLLPCKKLFPHTWQRPKSIEELSIASGMSMENIKRMLRDLMRQSHNIFCEDQELTEAFEAKDPNSLLFFVPACEDLSSSLSLRAKSPFITLEASNICRYLQEVSEGKKKAYFLGPSGERNFGAAMYFRKHKAKKAFAFKGDYKNLCLRLCL